MSDRRRLTSAGRAAVGAAGDAIVMIDEARRILVSSAAEQLFGYDADEVVGVTSCC